MKKREPAKVVISHRDNKTDFYCVKTTYHNNGKIESEIMVDEKTKLPLAIEIPDKPLDGVFETETATIYYTYHEGYAEAARQVAATGVHNRQMEQTISVDSFALSCHRHLAAFFLPEIEFGAVGLPLEGGDTKVHPVFYPFALYRFAVS